MKVTYIHHSGFLVELSDCLLLFDYYKGDLPAFDGTKPLFVFASHRHYDHYDKKIFAIENHGAKIYYVLSWDIVPPTIWDGEMPAITFMNPSERRVFEDGMVTVETLKSTDEGVAFVVTHGQETIYHGGDLNWWHWEEEGQDYNKKMAENYQFEIDKLSGRTIDIAFLPLDPRQGEQFYLGFDYFMKTTDTKLAYPMHCWGKIHVIDRLKALSEAKEYQEAIVSAEFFS